MKSIFAIAICTLWMAGAIAQVGSNRTLTISGNHTETQQFYIAANETGEQIALLVPAVQKVREAANRPSYKRFYYQFENLLKSAQNLARKIHATRGNMSTTQYQSYLRELSGLESQLTRLAAHAPPVNGDPKPGTMGECFKSCDDAYGPGLGGGKGWNKFWCKTGCILSKSVPGN